MTNPNVVANPTEWQIVRQWHFNRQGEDEYLRRQIYSMTVWIHEGVYFGLMSVYEYPGDISEGRETDLWRHHERDVMNFYIATSRDCDDWDLTWVYAGQPIVPRGVGMETFLTIDYGSTGIAASRRRYEVPLSVLMNSTAMSPSSS